MARGGATTATPPANPWALEVTAIRRCTLDEVKTYTLLDRDGRSYQSPTPGTVGGHRRGKIYGRLDCPTALRSIAKGQYVEHRVFFADEEAAIAAGYRPCGHCLRLEYRQWRVKQVT